jgi:very-short-patch-repair endonuclease
LGKVVAELEAQKRQESLEECYFDGKFDSRAEMNFYTAMQAHDLESLGLELRPKLVVKRYTLDFALVGRQRIDIEIDGKQHEIVGGLPIAGDAIRDEFLEREGWKVVRVPAHRVLADAREAAADLLASLGLDVDESPVRPGSTN